MRKLLTVWVLGVLSVACAHSGPAEKTPEVSASSAPSEGAQPWQDAARLTAMCDRHLAQATEIRERVKKPVSGARSLQNTLQPLNELAKDLDSAGGWAALMFNVHPDATVRKAAQECQKRLSAFSNETLMDQGLYQAVSAVPDSEVAGDAHASRMLAHTLRDFRRSGVDKDAATRKELKTIHDEITRLKQSYGKNVREDTRFIELDGPEQLAGMPADYIKSHQAKPGQKIRITTDYPDFYPFQRYAHNGDARRALYREYLSRGYPANKAVLEQILVLRHRYANLLGYPTWAAYNAADKMVKNAETVDGFIKKVTKLVKPRTDKDLAELLARKQQDDPKATQVESSDRFYYTHKVREAKYGFDAQKVRAYFPYAAVKKGIFDLYGELFGLSFEPLPDEPVWHPSVEAYAMRADGKLVGRFFLDNHPRADKYKHAAMFPVRTGLKSDRIPLASLVTNFPEPKADDKALMEHGEVVTFFHEFGHLIHHLLARGTDWVGLSGINVEWDFVETPSQILEEWAWDRAVLQRFARHAETGEPIPDALVAKMRGADEFGKGVHVMRQLFYTAYSFYLHHRDPKGLDLEAYTDEIGKGFSPYPRVEGGHVYANFGHLMGYSSMYYTYQWSLVIAKDLFTKFADKGLLDSSVARHYRKTILEPGGTKDAVDLVKDFLGRSYRLDAYQEWLQRGQ